MAPSIAFGTMGVGGEGGGEGGGGHVLGVARHKVSSARHGRFQCKEGTVLIESDRGGSGRSKNE